MSSVFVFFPTSACLKASLIVFSFSCLSLSISFFSFLSPFVLLIVFVSFSFIFSLPFPLFSILLFSSVVFLAGRLAYRMCLPLAALNAVVKFLGRVI